MYLPATGCTVEVVDPWVVVAVVPWLVEGDAVVVVGDCAVVVAGVVTACKTRKQPKK